MLLQVDKEAVNDTAKLMMHRLIARALAHQPAVLDQAKASAARIAEQYPDREFVQDWTKLLTLPVPQIRSRLISRDADMYRLRLSSPFVLVEGLRLADQDVRRRIYRGAKRIAERRLARRATHATQPAAR